jgi:hypothetical protein
MREVLGRDDTELFPPESVRALRLETDRELLAGG